MTLLSSALERKNFDRPPVWFMRQAGRYHSHYQKLKAQHSFLDLCKKPELACETTMGPIRDFDFDAAILFSDLLFPLEAMGMGLRYEPGPILEWHLSSKADLLKLKKGSDVLEHLQFQAQAVRLIRTNLSTDKALLGFVGGPLTLFFYAASGSHQKSDSRGIESAVRGMTDGRYQGFSEILLDLLAKNMALQADAGADAIAVLDTAAGEISSDLYRELGVPVLRALLTRFKALCPQTPVIYYSKNTGPEQWHALRDLAIDAIGIDWHHDLSQVLSQFTERFAIQGNIDPEWLFLPQTILEPKLRSVFEKVKSLSKSARAAWICGLGHGVLQKTPEENVKLFLRIQKEMFS